MKMKKVRLSPVIIGLLFLLAVVLLFAGSVGGTQAALNYRSGDYLSVLKMKHIGVTLLENGERVAWRNYGDDAASGFIDEGQDGKLVLKDLEDDPYFQVGRKYPFKITAKNTGGEKDLPTKPSKGIAQYLRITVYKYWVKVGDGETFRDKDWFHGISNYTTKICDTQYDPALIRLGYKEEGYNSEYWAWDSEAHTDERDVYYYKGDLKPGFETEALFDTLWIDPIVAKTVEKRVDGNVTTYSYAYDGYGFVVQAEVDAVQTHHARDAINSAWGTSDHIMDEMGIPRETE